MQVKVYCPKMVEIPSEYLPALAKRVARGHGAGGGGGFPLSASRR